MKIYRKLLPLQKDIPQLKRKNKTIGLVPTMGALHEGHLSLIRQARKENQILAVSIFVNPKQFGPQEDYLRYPRPFAKDRKLCQKEKVDILFVPSVKEMYPEGYLTYVQVEKMSEKLCGKFRPGHFRGVATVVAKLFNLIQPDRAYFGEKDFQQLQIIKKMVKDLNLPIEIIPCPTIRESDGLALSSRNTYLTPDERNRALSLNQALRKAKDLIVKQKVKDTKKIIQEMKKIIEPANPKKVDYIEICHPETFAPLRQAKPPLLIALAVWFGKTRLIDNLHLE
jgi:pantoate--beta-alanine ligase